MSRRHRHIHAPWWAAQRSSTGVLPTWAAQFNSGENGHYMAGGAAKPFAGAFTFTRDSVGTFFDAAGILQTAITDVARFDHNPATGARLGLLVEEERTNNLTRSEDASHGDWAKNSTTISSGDDISVKGITLNKLVATAGTFRRIEQSAVSLPAGDDAVYSVFIQDAGVPLTTIRIDDGTNDHFVRVPIDWDGAGVPTYGSDAAGGSSYLSYNSTGSKIEDMGGGLYRAILSVHNDGVGAITISAVYYVIFTPDPGGTRTTFAGGHQIELGKFVTSYVKTVASALTRKADLIKLVASGGLPFPGYNPVEGTIVVEFSYSGGGESNQTIFSIGTSSALRMDLLFRSSDGKAVFFVGDDGTQASLAGGTISVGTTHKVACAYKANQFGISLDGATEVTDPSGTIPAVDECHLGKRRDDSNATDDALLIKSFTFYPTAFVGSELEALAS